MPKLMTSARESSSRPNSLVVLVMRAMRPSSPSSTTRESDGFSGHFKILLRASAGIGA